MQTKNQVNLLKITLLSRADR